MKILSTIFLSLQMIALNSTAQITFEEVDCEAWIGAGSNETMFVVDFDSDSVGTDSTFAWGIRFESDSVSGMEIMDLIDQSDPDFSYTGGTFLDNISYTANNQTYTNPNTGWFSIVESSDGEAWAWNTGIGDNVGNGQWFGIVVMDPDTWEAEINVPLLETGVGELDAHNVKIYPNPASEKLNIDTPGHAKILVMNTYGRVIYRTFGKKESLDLTNRTPGLYVVTVVYKDRTINKKILVQ